MGPEAQGDQASEPEAPITEDMTLIAKGRRRRFRLR